MTNPNTSRLRELAADTTAQWCRRKFKTRFDREWQLAKVELRLGCSDGGGDWRDNLLAQQAALRSLLNTRSTLTDQGEG